MILCIRALSGHVIVIFKLFILIGRLGIATFSVHISPKVTFCLKYSALAPVYLTGLSVLVYESTRLSEGLIH